MIELKNITKSFDGKKIVDSVSFSVDKGEKVILLGPSGSGKTTLLRIIAGFEKPDKGEVLIDSKYINELIPFDRNIGMVFQDLALWPHMTVKENVTFCVQDKKNVVQIADRILSNVGLSAYAQCYPGQLSGGEKQRLALARSLVRKPDLLLLDEPLANIDVLLKDELKKLIDGFQKSMNTTVIYVTHDQNEALQLSDRLIILSGGKIEQIAALRRKYALTLKLNL